MYVVMLMLVLYCLISSQLLFSMKPKDPRLGMRLFTNTA